MNENNEVKKLKPVSFITGKYNYYGKDRLKEFLLLKALRVTNDPKLLRDMIGAKTIADVSRTFDKIANRKEYYSSLKKLGMDFTWIAKGLKVEAETAEKSADRIKALQIVLKSLGMDKYEDVQADTGSWEDLILKSADKTKEIEAPIQDAEYEVARPVMPESLKKQKEDEGTAGRNLYE